MSSIHGVNVGGNLFDITDSSNVAPIELTGSATRGYAKGRLLILSNGLLYKTTRAINSGETLIANNNIRQTNVDELIAELDTDSNLIAPTEDGTTSSDDYSIGEQIARSGLLYEVIDDITAGDTFVVGNNIKLAGSVTEQLFSNATEIHNISDEITDMNNVLGAKNLLPNNGVGTSTDNGITYTKQSDGSVVANGTATGWAYYNLCSRFTLDAGTYILSGKEAKVATQIKILNADTEADVTILEGNNTEKQFTLNTKTTLHAMLYVGVDAATVTNFVFYPMIRLASIQDDTYEPYSMTNREMTPYVQVISNPNLLDNPWFTVNQRGQSSYSGESTPVAFVDRWKMNDGMSCVVNADKTLTFTNSDPTVHKYFCNRFEHGIVEGKTITLSVLLSDGTILTQTDIFPATTNTLIDKAFNKGGIESFRLQNVANFSQAVIFIAPNSSATVKAVKLELGSVSTLAMDTVPNYQQELAKCQRYFYRPINGTTTALFQGINFDTTSVRFGISLPTPMRTTPTITHNLGTRAQLIDDGAVKPVSDAMTVTINSATPNMIVVSVNGFTGLTANTPIIMKTNNAYINLSAEL